MDIQERYAGNRETSDALVDAADAICHAQRDILCALCHAAEAAGVDLAAYGITVPEWST